MNVHMRPTVSKESEEMLEDLAESLEISDDRYEQAEKRYKSLGEWLNRPESTIRQYRPQVHVQGSFGLGTVTPPLTDADEYDVDVVCEFRRLTKLDKTQAELKALLEVEMRLYARRHNMHKPLEEHRRCWRQPYADEAQFHIDVTPAVLNGAELTAMLSARGFDTPLAQTAISITDNRHPHYYVISTDWQRSNPRGYLKWFLDRMATVYEKRKARLLQKGVRAGTEPIPDPAAAGHHDPEAPPRYHVRQQERRQADLHHPDHARRPFLRRRGEDLGRTLRDPVEDGPVHHPRRGWQLHHLQSERPA